MRTINKHKKYRSVTEMVNDISSKRFKKLFHKIMEEKMAKNCGTCKCRVEEDNEYHYICSVVGKRKRVRKSDRACKNYSAKRGI